MKKKKKRKEANLGICCKTWVVMLAPVPSPALSFLKMRLLILSLKPCVLLGAVWQCWYLLSCDTGHVQSAWAPRSHGQQSEVWWCLWREEALGRAAPLGPLGRLWLSGQLWGYAHWAGREGLPAVKTVDCETKIITSHSIRLSVSPSVCTTFLHRPASPVAYTLSASTPNNANVT